MKLPCIRQRASGKALGHRGALAYTLTEVMVTMAVMMMVMAAVISCHLLGLRMYELTKAKLGASDDARKAISLIISEVRSAKNVRVGSGDAASFKEVGLDTPHVGSSIQVYASTNTNNWVRYFWDMSDQKVKRVNSAGSPVQVVASSISNEMVFSVEDFTGTPLMNNAMECVISLNLQFYQLQYPSVTIGPGKHYNYYQLQTRVTPRAP